MAKKKEKITRIKRDGKLMMTQKYDGLCYLEAECEKIRFQNQIFLFLPFEMTVEKYSLFG